jgi:hypothetical protein
MPIMNSLTTACFMQSLRQVKHNIFVNSWGCVTMDGVWIEWLDVLRLYTLLETKSNYSAIANHHNSQFTTAPAKPFPACCVFTSRSLATASNSVDSSASRAQVLPSPTLVQNCLPAVFSEPNWIAISSQPPLQSSTALSTTKPQPSSFTAILHGANRKHRFQQCLYCCLRILCHGAINPVPGGITGPPCSWGI